MAIRHISKGKAQLMVSVGSSSKGNRKWVTKTVTYKKKKELEKLYQAFEDEIRRNPLTATTVDELIESYIGNARVRGLSENTLHGYKSAQKRIESAFKGVLARSLKTYQIDDFIAEMAKKYAPKTVANTIGLLDAAYQRAVKGGQLSENPCIGVTLPKKKKKEIQTLSAEQMMRFIDALNKERIDIRVGYKLCLMCGLRRGEVLGLTEKDVSVLFRTVSINKARYVVEGKDVIQEPKTARSKRILAMPQILADEIRQLIDEHHAQEYHHSDFLIQDAFGDPLSPSVFSGVIKKIDPDITVHGLRHTFATLLNAKNVDIAQISAELGHSNITTTMNLYMHIFGDATSSSRGIADTIDAVFDKKVANELREAKEKTAGA